MVEGEVSQEGKEEGRTVAAAALLMGRLGGKGLEGGEGG